MVTKSQFIGVLIGEALGDALGFLVEGQDAEQCEEFITNYLEKGLIPEFKRSIFGFGQYTDDTQLAREMVQSFLDCKKFNPEDYARRIANIFDENRIVGRGMATMEAAMKLISGTNWTESGTPPPYAGNGFSMRAGPIGLFFYKSEKLLIEGARNQGIITHKDPRSIAGSVLIAGSVSYVLRQKKDSIKTNDMLNHLHLLIQPISELFASELLKLKEWLNLSVEEAAPIIGGSGNPDVLSEGWRWISPYVIPAVLWSLYSFLKFPNDFTMAIFTSIRAGGDVDTTAAMTGAISGAYLGNDVIQQNEIMKLYSSHLTDQKTWEYEELKKLMKDLFQIVEQS